VRDYVARLDMEMRPSSVALTIQSLCYASRLIAGERDWRWLSAIKARLVARARPIDRFDHLTPPCQTLDFGIELMDTALALPMTSRKTRELQYRDGLILALLSLWPIRRRSLAALTVSQHIEIENDGVNLLLHPADTKSERFESFRAPEPLVPYLNRYLKDIRPRLLGPRPNDGLWASYRHGTLTDSGLYEIARTRLLKRFGRDMCLHDFRRSAATYLAIDAPEQIGLIPGVLQHSSPDVAERHYNLANAVKASQRLAQHRASVKNGLRLLATNADASEVGAPACPRPRRGK
jgi:integrase